MSHYHFGNRCDIKGTHATLNGRYDIKGRLTSIFEQPLKVTLKCGKKVKIFKRACFY